MSDLSKSALPYDEALIDCLYRPGWPLIPKIRTSTFGVLTWPKRLVNWLFHLEDRKPLRSWPPRCDFELCDREATSCFGGQRMVDGRLIESSNVRCDEHFHYPCPVDGRLDCRDNDHLFAPFGPIPKGMRLQTDDELTRLTSGYSIDVLSYPPFVRPVRRGGNGLRRGVSR